MSVSLQKLCTILGYLVTDSIFYRYHKTWVVTRNIRLRYISFITVNRRRLVRLASDVTEYVIVHFLFWSCDQYRAWMLKSYITNNNIITVFADLRTVFSQLILLSELLTT